MHYMVTNQKSHQENRTANLRQLTSNLGPLLPEPILYFQLSWEKMNHHAIDNGDITSDVPVESNYDSVPYPDTPPIKSIDDDEMDHLLEFFHSEHDDDLLDVDLQMLQA